MNGKQHATITSLGADCAVVGTEDPDPSLIVREPANTALLDVVSGDESFLHSEGTETTSHLVVASRPIPVRVLLDNPYRFSGATGQSILDLGSIKVVKNLFLTDGSFHSTRAYLIILLSNGSELLLSR